LTRQDPAQELHKGEVAASRSRHILGKQSVSYSSYIEAGRYTYQPTHCHLLPYKRPIENWDLQE